MTDGPTPRRSTDEVRAQLRRARGFRVDEVVAAKVGRIDRWFGDEGLDAAVVGLSGGIDSAVVLGLLCRAAALPGAMVRQVVAVSIPVVGPGATGQPEAEARARRIAEAFDAELWCCPLEAVHARLLEALQAAAGRAISPWAAGQVLSVERTPVLYGAAAVLQSAGARSVVVGTTNRDEGAYLGFFGKASDGMVDVQPISDLHKSEVVAVGRALGVPIDVVEAAPSGDVWDGRTDAEMIGAPYDDVELVLRLREVGLAPSVVAGTLVDGDRLRRADEAVERLHRTNGHKYVTGGHAVHLDVLPRCVPGGWRPEVDQRHPPDPAPVGLPGAWHAPAIELDGPALPTAVERGGVVVADGVLSPSECGRLLAALDGAPGQPVGVTGIVGDHGIGSTRSTAFDEVLAAALWRKLHPVVPAMRFLGALDPSEGHRTAARDGHRTWRAVGLSPLLRFMRYERDGRHLCHYDAAYEYPDGRRTLLSVVVFLTGDGTPDRGGSLRFVDDGQSDLPVWERAHDDWSVEADPAAVIDRVAPLAGRAALFDHRRCHDVERWLGDEPRVVIRADVVYEPVPDGRGLG
jgi:NAD+ synthetase